ncbi:MAG: chromate transporter [Allobaculum sp.]|nr:chromate transporter [Allobaculum sp.]
MNIYLDLFLTFFKIGLFTFGGGLAMLPMLEKEVVNNKKWATYDQLMDYYAIGQCTPGIIAVNTATFVGYSQKKTPGAIVATAGVVTPSVIIIILIASLMTSFADQPIVQHALAGIRIAVCVLIAQAVIKMTKSGVRNWFGLILFVVIFIATYLDFLPVTVAIIIGAVVAIVYCELMQKKTGLNPALEAKKKNEKA